MRTIIFSWEYPPWVVGQLAEYVSKLSSLLVRKKVETYVITFHDSLTGTVEEANGVKVVRVANPIRTNINPLTWNLTLNQEIERVTANIYYQENGRIDLINVYEWHFIPAAITLKKAFNIPFVYSVESIEDQRSPHSNTPYNMSIKSIEWLGFYEAQKVSVKTEFMKDEITRVYRVPEEKIKVLSPLRESWIMDVLELYNSVAGGSEDEA